MFFVCGGKVYDPDAKAFFARMDVNPSATRKRLYNDVFVALKDYSLFTKLDALWFMAAHDAQAARLNLKSTSHTITTISSPTFVTDRGYNGDGSASYLNSNLNPTTSGNYSQNSAHIGIYSRTNDAGGTFADIGCRISTNSGQAMLFVRLGSGAYSPRINTGIGPSISSVPSNGHIVGTRNSSGTVNGYRNGSNLGNPATTSQAAYSGNMFIGAVNTSGVAGSFSARQYAAAHVGSGLNDTEVSNLYSVINTYLTSIGANA